MNREKSVSHLLPDESAHDEHVAEYDDAERHSADENERQPRTNVEFEVAVLGGRPAADPLQYQLSRSVAALPLLELGASSPHNVKVLADGGQQCGGGEVLGPPRLTGGRAAFERETDGEEAVQGEDDADPDGSVAAGVERELLKFAERCARLLTTHNIVIA